MKILINNVKVTDDFLNYLIKYILIYFMKIIDRDKLVKWTEYLNKNLKFPTNINAYDILIAGIKNLGYTSSKEEYKDIEIFINPNILYYRTNYKLFALCKLINFGTLGIKGYNIFTQTFTYIKENISTIIEQYKLGGFYVALSL